MNEPEKVYAVATRYERASVEEAIVVKRTANCVYLRYESSSAAFGTRNRIPKDEPCLAPTKAEALRRALIQADRNAKTIQHKLTNALNYVARLHTELEKEIALDQPK